MPDILIINGTPFPVPEGGFDIKSKDKVNKYEAENGQTTIEIIRKGVTTITVSYKGIPEQQLNGLIGKLDATNTVTYDKNGVQTTTLMSCTEQSTPKQYYGNGIYMKGLSFTLEEL